MRWHTGLIDGDRIDRAAWTECWNTSMPVGLCAEPCRGLVLVVPTVDRTGQERPSELVGFTEWFTSRCNTCGVERTSPGGRLQGKTYAM